MVRLGQEFIIQMHVSCKPTDLRRLIQTMQKSKELKPLNVQCNSISRRDTGTYQQPVMDVSVKCVGADQPGMLAAISERLRDEGLGIESVTTEIQKGRDGRREFVVLADCVKTTHIDHDGLVKMSDSIGTLKSQLNLDVVDVRVQRLVPGHQATRRLTTRTRR